jgi:sulfur carrier protein
MDRITVNGHERPVATGMTLAQLVGELGLQGKRIAVEINGDIVPRSQHAETLLKPGDHIEVVVAVGGG